MKGRLVFGFSILYMGSKTKSLNLYFEQEKQ